MSSDHHDIINWEDETHQRIIAATFVQGSYKIESEHHGKDMQGLEKAKDSVARLGFEIYEFIKSNKYGSIGGTIYRYNGRNVNPPDSIPKFVIAFRGTCLDRETVKDDLISDLMFVSHLLGTSTRCADAVEAAEYIISISGGPENVWLTGHSLGAAISLDVARKMIIRKSILVKTYLFNPPFTALGCYRPFNYIYFAARTVVTAGLDYLVQMTDEERGEVFDKLKSWSPYLYVNKRDLISSGYKLYFRQRKIMRLVGLGGVENRAAQNSVISLATKSMGFKLEPMHLIPNANLFITKRRHNPHNLDQWLEKKLHVKKKTYVFEKRR